MGSSCGFLASIPVFSGVGEGSEMKSKHSYNVTSSGTRITPILVAMQSRPVFEKYRIQKAILFGSIAVERQSKRSDIDLILIQATDKPYFERFEGLLKDLYQALPGRDLEVFIYTPEELQRISHRRFIHRALQEGKIIYESG
jgi:predicted nucleotidyltransferase